MRRQIRRREQMDGHRLARRIAHQRRIAQRCAAARLHQSPQDRASGPCARQPRQLVMVDPSGRERAIGRKAMVYGHGMGR